MPPRVLFVALQGSIHAARWIECIAELGWDLHMFGANDAPPNGNLRGVTLHTPVDTRATVEPPVAPPPTPRPTPLARLLGLAGRLRRDPTGTLRHVTHRVERLVAERLKPWTAPERAPPPPKYRPAFVAAELDRFGIPREGMVPVGASGAEAWPMWSPPVLAKVIDQVRPDLIHSMEFQHNSYRVLEAIPLLQHPRPAWLVTNWGSDIFQFGYKPGHSETIRRMLNTAEFYSCECRRDLELGRAFGYTGPELPVLPNSGGFDLDHARALRGPLPPSRRRRIMVKGYDNFAGRAMMSLAVLERFAGRLRDYEIVLYSVGSRPRARAMELKASG